MKILIDAYGGDNAPVAIIKGAIAALAEEKDFSIVLSGKKEGIEEVLATLRYDKSRVEILDAPTVITCDEEPTVAIRQKPDSSMCMAFKMLKDNCADAFVSAGSSGALLVGSTLKVGRIQGVSRPALCPVLPTRDPDKRTLLLDAGANADCKPINLVQFAIMGSEYAKALGVEKPRVALLSNGTEEKKGNQLTHEVYAELAKLDCIDFAGNCEARDIMAGVYDVVVTDGFSGNIALKGMEGAIGALMKIIKMELMSSFKGKIAGLLLKDAFKNIKAKMDYNSLAGAVFLGVGKVVIKTHGTSGETAIKNSVLQAVSTVRAGLVENIKQRLSEVDLGGIAAQ